MSWVLRQNWEGREYKSFVQEKGQKRVLFKRVTGRKGLIYGIRGSVEKIEIRIDESCLYQ